MAGRFDFRSPGAAFNRGLQDALLQREVARRQQLLDGIALEGEMRRRQQEDAQARRQAIIDANSAADRTASIVGTDQDLSPEQSSVLRAGGYQVADSMTLPSTSRVGDLASGTLNTSVATPSGYARRLQTPAEQRAQAEAAAKAAERERERQEKAREKAEERAYNEARDREKREYEAAEKERDRRHALQLESLRQSGRSASEPKAPTQGERTADTFTARAQEANSAIGTVENNIGWWQLLTPEFLQSANGQVYLQAKRQFIESYLRKDSGAAIGKDEYANADRAYFPQATDSDAVRERKRQAREQIINSMRLQGSHSVTGSGSSGPRVGERRMINGQLGEWDGRGWLPVGSGR